MGRIIKFTYVRKTRVNIMNNIDITTKRKKEIEEITKKLSSHIDFKKSPYVDIVSLVKKDGFDVIPERMDLDTTGCLFCNQENKQRIIVVNTIFKNPDNENDVIFKKSRFITAHEYGHYILHKEGRKQIFAHRDTYHRTEPKELEADYFARSILMPIDQFSVYASVLNDMGNDKNFTVEFLSKIFKVTRNKVMKRMEDLSELNR